MARKIRLPIAMPAEAPAENNASADALRERGPVVIWGFKFVEQRQDVVLLGTVKQTLSEKPYVYASLE